MHESQHASQHSHVLVHSGLKSHFDPTHPTHSTHPSDAPLDMLRRSLDRVDFIDDEDLAATDAAALDLPVLLPVNSEFQAEQLRAIRVRHPLALLIAVTNDVSGHHTYYAIRSGANFVFNLAISGESQIGMVHAQLSAHAAAHAEEADAEEPRRQPRPARPALPDVPELRRDERELVRELCTSMTVNEIARRHYCSERSMYRRIRRLYDELGVRGRSELVSLASAPAGAAPVGTTPFRFRTHADRTDTDRARPKRAS
ncbi:MAG: response regulator transcription factor [Streptomyces sp.]|nr:response regulator transcription factor [Streptomyces sp.]NUT28995.1 response regulator transcription factor [Streptomyces sp.]